MSMGYNVACEKKKKALGENRASEGLPLVA